MILIVKKSFVLQGDFTNETQVNEIIIMGDQQDTTQMITNVYGNKNWERYDLAEDFPPIIPQYLWGNRLLNIKG